MHDCAASQKLSNAKENALLERAKQGDERAFTELVRQYEDLVYNFSFKVCRDRGAATETLQDTFVNVYRKLGQFDGKSKFSTWLYAIVANNCLMKRRRAKLEKASVSIDEPSPPGSAPGGIDGESGAEVPLPLDEARPPADAGARAAG